jgi:propanol-preferring alcohol dehydrogenase
MKAALLTEYRQPLTIASVTEPRCPPGGALVRVGGAGVCHSDPHVARGRLRELLNLALPAILGHEIAGYVEATGPGVAGPAPGTPVVVYGAAHCGRCVQCLRGREQLCPDGSWLGLGAPGGYAELVAVPDVRQLIPLDGIDPVEAAVLTDAGATTYHAVRHVAGRVGPDSALVVVGLGGLGQYAVQFARLLTPAIVIAAVRNASAKAAMARRLGADEVVDLLDADPVAATRRLCPSGGADAVIDLVTAANTATFARDVLAPGGIHVAAGLDGGTIEFGWDSVPLESSHVSTFWGTQRDLCEVLALRQRGLIHSDVHPRQLSEINQIFDELDRSATVGRNVVVP